MQDAKPLTTSSVAKVLGVSEAAVRQMEARGVLHAERTETGMRLFDRDEVERVAAARRRRLASIAAA